MYIVVTFVLVFHERLSWFPLLSSKVFKLLDVCQIHGF